MTIIEITSYHHVILRALQRKLPEGPDGKSMTFSELWRSIEAAAPFIKPNMRPPNKTDIAREILWGTGELDEGMIITRDVRAGKLISITLTEFGEKYLRSTIFSHQERAPEPQPQHRTTFPPLTKGRVREGS